MQGNIRNGHNRKHRLLTRIPIFSPADTIAKARHVIEQRHDWQSVNYLYLLDRNKNLKGVVSIKQLLTSPLEATLSTLSKREVFSVHVKTSSERAAILAIHHGIKTVPVVDRRGKFLGVLGTDDIMQTLQHAGIDDAIRYSGIHLEHRGLLDVLHGRVLFLTRRRLPWLLVGLLGGLASSVFVGHFEGVLREVVELAFFSPAIVYMGAAVGSQTQALFLRAITIGEVRVSKFLVKEIFIDGLIGIVLGGLAFGGVSLLLQDKTIAAIVGISMFLTILVSGLVAILMASMLSARKEDPALGAGPFATIVQDIVSLLIYFSVATIILSSTGLR